MRRWSLALFGVALGTIAAHFARHRHATSALALAAAVVATCGHLRRRNDLQRYRTSTPPPSSFLAGRDELLLALALGPALMAATSALLVGRVAPLVGFYSVAVMVYTLAYGVRISIIPCLWAVCNTIGDACAAVATERTRRAAGAPHGPRDSVAGAQTGL